MKQRHYIVFVWFLCVLQVAVSQNSTFDSLRIDFIKGYTKLQIPNLQINYVNTLQSIKSKDEIRLQQQFFQKIKNKLSKVNITALNSDQLIDFHIMTYETALNLERVEIEKQWSTNTNLDDSKSIFTTQNGKDWYAYLLKRWVDINVSPDEMYQFGLTEIAKVKTRMKYLQESSGISEKAFQKCLMESTFYYENVKDVKQAFENTKINVAKSAATIFPYIDNIPDVNIAQGTNAALSHVPAYYDNSTFYFNYFGAPFNKRQIDWIYIHEGIPGHHYQIMVNNVIKRTEIQELFWYSGFVEGWGAYVEHLGKELGVYKTIYDEYGKWEWDLIRSVRVALDVGINYYGWSDEKSISFWKEHISDKDKVGWREIARMKRWPAQVITYKYGADIILKLLHAAKRSKTFDYKKFHENILKNGDVPLFVLRILTALEEG